MLDDVRQWLKSLNFPLDSFELNGKWHRFSRGGRDKNCWFVGSYTTLDNGKEIAVATVGDWSTDEKHVYRPEIKLTDDQKKKLREESKKQREEIRKAKEQEWLRVRKDTECKYEKLPKAQTTNYLTKKKVQPQDVPSLRGTKEYTIVPNVDENNKIWGFQRIGADGSKRFKGGQKKKGLFCPIPDFESVKNSKTILVAEGFATAYSVWKATGIPSVAAFDAGNLLPCGELLFKSFKKQLIFCADNDQYKNENVGVKKACEAAKKLGMKAVWPEFKNKENKPTDFNDLYVLEGPDALNFIKKPKVDQPNHNPITCLGWNSEGYYYTSDENKDIVRIPISHASHYLLHLMPMEYWIETYGEKKGSWMKAASDLMEKSRKVGIFDPRKIRGIGCWKEGDKIVLHQGDRLLVNGKNIPLRELKTRNIYQLRTAQSEIDSPALHNQEASVLLKACRALEWQHPYMADLLAGYFAVFRLCGALQWRPHCWITGPAGSGKSTVMKLIAENLAGNAALIAFGNSTEAGVRQTLRNDAVPVLMDEAEVKGGDKRIKNIVDLARLSSAQSSARSLRGTPEGKSYDYVCNSSFLFCSIQNALDEEADQSRFILLRLSRHKKSWAEVEKEIDPITKKFGEGLFKRVVSLFSELEQSIKTFQRVLAECRTERFAQQYAPILAGKWILENSEPITPQEAGKASLELLRNMELAGPEKMETDEEACLNHLLQYKLLVEVPALSGYAKPSPETMSVGDMVERVAREEIPENVLYLYGLALRRGCLSIASSNPELERIYKGTKWESRWSGSLINLPNASQARNRMIPRFRALWNVSVPLENIFQKD